MTTYSGRPGVYMSKARAQRIYAFREGAYWSAIFLGASLFLFGWIALGDGARALALGSGGLMLGVLIASCLTDLTSMRIEDRVCLLGLVASVGLWASYALGVPIVEGPGYGKQVYGFLTGMSETGLLFPFESSAALWPHVGWSILAAFLLGFPILASVLVGMMAAL